MDWFFISPDLPCLIGNIEGAIGAVALFIKRASEAREEWEKIQTQLVTLQSILNRLQCDTEAAVNKSDDLRANVCREINNCIQTVGEIQNVVDMHRGRRLAPARWAGIGRHRIKELNQSQSESIQTLKLTLEVATNCSINASRAILGSLNTDYGDIKANVQSIRENTETMAVAQDKILKLLSLRGQMATHYTNNSNLDVKSPIGLRMEEYDAIVSTVDTGHSSSPELEDDQEECHFVNGVTGFSIDTNYCCGSKEFIDPAIWSVFTNDSSFSITSEWGAHSYEEREPPVFSKTERTLDRQKTCETFQQNVWAAAKPDPGQSVSTAQAVPAGPPVISKPEKIRNDFKLQVNTLVENQPHEISPGRKAPKNGDTAGAAWNITTQRKEKVFNELQKKIQESLKSRSE